MTIPSTIKVGKTVYSVHLHPDMQSHLYGGIHYRDARIYVSTRNVRTGELHTKRRQVDTFWHELTHAILKDMNNKLEANEQFVDGFSKRLSNAIRSAKF